MYQRKSLALGCFAGLLLIANAKAVAVNHYPPWSAYLVQVFDLYLDRNHNMKSVGPAQDDLIHKPEIAAERLYDAWIKRNRTAALKVAPQEIVEKLFSHRAVVMNFRGCTDAPRKDSEELPSYKCLYVASKYATTLEITLSGGASVGFSASEIRLRKGDSASSTDKENGKATDPVIAATRLYDAWRTQNRPTALQIASQESVDKLFSTIWHPMKFTGCKNVDGAYQCIYHELKLDYTVSFGVRGTPTVGYRVEQVSYSSEE